MLFENLQEQAALKDYVGRGDETAEALEAFLLSHYATPHPEAEYLGRVVKNVVGITGAYYLALPPEKKLSLTFGGGLVAVTPEMAAKSGFSCKPRTVRKTCNRQCL